MPKNKIMSISSADNEMYCTYNTVSEKNRAIGKMNAGMASSNLGHSQANNRYKNVAPNISVIDEFNRSDYEWFRPGEALPQRPEEIIAACMCAYKRNPIVHDIVDMMSDFTCQGITLVHENKKYEKLFKSWAEKVDMYGVSRRFVSMLCRSGNPVVNMTTGKLKPSEVSKLERMYAADFDSIPKDFVLEKREIPWKYYVLNPLTFEPIGKELAIFAGKPILGLKLPNNLRNLINNPKNDVEKSIVDSLPPNIKEAAGQDSRIVPMDPDKVKVYHYNKDDFELWANPMLAHVLNDVIQFNKYQLADMAALDGMLSHIRIWALGNLEHKILPGQGAIDKFNDMIANHAGGGTIDITWNPAINLIESKKDGATFLGSEKYEICLGNIYAGLGVPPSLTGLDTKGSSSNNFISTKVLIERLKYLRSILIKFWIEQIKLVQISLGIPKMARLVFDQINLSDEAAEKALWVQLFDRNIISLETMQERFGQIPDIEQARIRREFKSRKSGRMPPKSGPFNDSEPELSLQKIALQRGAVTPSEVGLELEERKPGELSQFDMQMKLAKATKPPASNLKGQPGQGRPKNAKDSTKRKTKRKTVKTGKTTAMVDNVFWAKSEAANLRHIIFPAYIKAMKVKKVEDLGLEARVNAERLLFTTLCHLTEDKNSNSEILEIMKGELENADLTDRIFDTELAFLFNDGVPSEDVINEHVAFMFSALTCE